ncbi:MAG TPA: hypothetical protein VNM14_12670 [Planctomycetota bacterium]|jgi:hypothetical protein|nr:hypothetical protein [Planctomycetota bacterium]
MILSVLLALLLSADGAELPRGMQLDEPRLSVPVAEFQADSFHVGVTLAAQGRVSLPFGSADRGSILVSGNTIAIVNRLDYHDIFNVGWGFTLEGDVMWQPPPPHADEPLWARPVEMGGYVAFECDWFKGSAADDSSGTRIRPDDLQLPSVFVGFKAAGAVRDALFGDVRVGLGAAHFRSLKARYQVPGGPDTKQELFADTWTFAMEARFHFGWDLGFGAIVFGMGGRLIAPPDRGAGSTLDPDILWTLDFELGLQIGF